MFRGRTSRALAAGGAALAIAAVGLAGCGGDDGGSTTAAGGVTTATAPELSIAAAAAAYAPIRAEIVAIGRDLGSAVATAGSATDAELADRFSALAVRAEAAVTRLEGLNVPARVDTALDDLREALADGAEDLRAVATAAREHDAQAAREATQRLVGDSAGIRQARAQVEAQLPPARG